MSLNQFGETLELRAEVEIHARPAAIWRRLTDFNDYVSWNPYVVRAKGKLDVGERVDLVLSPPGGSEVKVKRHILELRESEELRWQGPYGFGIWLRSEQYFRLREGRSTENTRLLIGENLKGPGVTSNNQLVMNIARGLALMNQALKRRLESAFGARENST